MFQWFAETLISQYPDGVVTDQIIFIDSFIHHEEGRTERDCLEEHFQGPH